MTKVDVDVLIPVYNAASTLEEAISSIRQQSLGSIRIVVVDDGSTDSSPEILKLLQAADPRIDIIRKENGGIVDALNLGLTRCSARYLARFDADDISYVHRLETQVAYLDTNPDCVAVAGRVEHIDSQGHPLTGLPQPGSPDEADSTWAPAKEPYLIHPFLLVRRAVLDAVGGYRYVNNSEDSDLYWRLSEIGRLHNLDAVLGKYRVHSSSISSSSIINSRIMSISSQLGAISAQRRRKRLDDLKFDKETHQIFRDLVTLDAMWSHASKQLTNAEAHHLRIAASIKLLELAGYRPIALEKSDCKFIRASLQAADLPEANRKEIRWYITTTAARLMRKGRYYEAAALLPAPDYPIAFARAIRGF